MITGLMVQTTLNAHKVVCLAGGTSGQDINLACLYHFKVATSDGKVCYIQFDQASINFVAASTKGLKIGTNAIPAFFVSKNTNTNKITNGGNVMQSMQISGADIGTLMKAYNYPRSLSSVDIGIALDTKTVYASNVVQAKNNLLPCICSSPPYCP